MTHRFLLARRLAFFSIAAAAVLMMSCGGDTGLTREGLVLRLPPNDGCVDAQSEFFVSVCRTEVDGCQAVELRRVGASELGDGSDCISVQEGTGGAGNLLGFEMNDVRDGARYQLSVRGVTAERDVCAWGQTTFDAGEGPIEVALTNVGSRPGSVALSPPRAFHRALTLSNGDVLVLGGVDPDGLPADTDDAPVESLVAEPVGVVQVFRKDTMSLERVQSPDGSELSLRRVMFGAVLDTSASSESESVVRVLGGFESGLYFEARPVASSGLPLMPAESVESVLTGASDLLLTYNHATRTLAVTEASGGGGYASADADAVLRGATTVCGRGGGGGPAEDCGGDHLAGEGAISVSGSAVTGATSLFGLGGSITKTTGGALVVSGEAYLTTGDLASGISLQPRVFHAAVSVGDAVHVVGGLGVAAATVTREVAGSESASPTGEVNALSVELGAFPAATSVEVGVDGRSGELGFVSGGWQPSSFTAESSAFRLDDRGAATPLPLGEARFAHTATSLGDGRVVVIGGAKPAASGDALMPAGTLEIVDLVDASARSCSALRSE